MFASIKSWTCLKLGHVGSKSMSLGQILEKRCVCPRTLSFSPILMKLGQNVCLNEILDEFENVVKNLVTSEKPCVHSRGHVFSSILLKSGQNVCFGDFLDTGYIE